MTRISPGATGLVSPSVTNPEGLNRLPYFLTTLILLHIISSVYYIYA